MNVAIVILYEKINERVFLEGSALIEEGYQIQTYLWKRGGLQEPQRTEVEDQKMGAVYIDVPWHGELYRLVGALFRFFARLWRRLDDEQPDVLHVTHFALLPFALAWKIRYRGKVVYDCFEFHAHSIARRLPIGRRVLRRILYWVEGFLASKCDAVLTVTSADDFLVKWYKRFNPNSHVLRNVPPVDIAPDEDAVCRLTEKYQDQRIALYVGHISEDKGSLRMLRLLKRLHEKGEPLRLVCVGSFRKGSRDEFWTLANELDIADFIDEVPWVPFREMLAYVSVATLGLAIFDEEDQRIRLLGVGNARKLFIYLRFGLPLVISDFGQMGAFVSKQGIGIVMKEDDSDTNIDQLIKVLNDEEAHKEMSKKGRELIEQDFNWNVDKARLLGVYRGLTISGRVRHLD